MRDSARKITHGDVNGVDAFAAAQARVIVVRTAQKLQPDAEEEGRHGELRRPPDGAPDALRRNAEPLFRLVVSR